MQTRYILLLITIIFLNSEDVNAESDDFDWGDADIIIPGVKFEMEMAYIDKIDYLYSIPGVNLDSFECLMTMTMNSREISINCLVNNLQTTECNCHKGTMIGFEPDTEYIINIKHKTKSDWSEEEDEIVVLKTEKFRTASKHTLETEKIGLSSYEYVTEVDNSKMFPKSCRVCVVKDRNSDQCCTKDYYTGKGVCATKKFTNLEPGTTYDFIICDIKGGQSIKKSFTTISTPKTFNVKFGNTEIFYELTYGDSANQPTGTCLGSFVNHKEAICKANITCNCLSGTYILPTGEENHRFKLKLNDEILVDYNKDGPGPENPNYYVGKMEGSKLTTSDYQITNRDNDIGDAICNFYVNRNTKLKCQDSTGAKTTDCKCASGRLVDLTPNTDYKIKVTLKDKKDILSVLMLKTAEEGKISREFIGLNKYKYELSYSYESGSNKPDQCKVCLVNRLSNENCCDEHSAHSTFQACTSHEFTVESSGSKTLKLIVCDAHGSQMLTKNIDLASSPSSSIILMHENRIRYRLKYGDINIPTDCKFFIDEEEKTDLHCSSNTLCNCELGAFHNIPNNDKFKFTIKDIGGNVLASNNFDGTKTNDHFLKKEEACSTFNI